MRTNAFMLSLPNSGSSWLGEMIGHCLTDGGAYYRGYFNPATCPQEHELRIGEHFGDELLAYYKNIALPAGPGFDELIRETWFAQDRFTFTKDVLNPLKLEGLSRHFRCFVLHRSEASSWPPSRSRVLSFYEHAWHAMVEAGFELGERTLHARALEARRVLTEALHGQAHRLGVPILDYDEIMEASATELATLFEPLVGFQCDVERLGEGIAQTRRRRTSRTWVEGGKNEAFGGWANLG